MPKFFFLPSVYEPNTAATNRMLSYMKGFSEAGIKTTVVYFRPNSKHDFYDAHLDNIEIKNYWKTLYLNWGPLKYLSLLCYIVHFICSLKKGDIVYCYNSAEIWYWILKFRKGIKVHVEYTEHPEVRGIGGKFLTPSFEQFYQSIQSVDGLFVITTHLRDFFISKGVSAEVIHIANITVDPSRFSGLVKNPDAEPYIAYCGTLSNNKDGVDLLIKSYAETVKCYPDIKLYIIGSAPKETELNQNIKLIHELGLQQSVRLTGVITAEKMPQVLKDALLLVLNRPDNLQAKNGFATKIGEYLLTENPVVLTSVGDFPLFFKDGVNAFVSVPDNPTQFANKMIQALSDYDKAKIVGLNGAKLALDNFTYQSVTKKIVQVLGLIK